MLLPIACGMLMDVVSWTASATGRVGLSCRDIDNLPKPTLLQRQLVARCRHYKSNIRIRLPTNPAVPSHGDFALQLLLNTIKMSSKGFGKRMGFKRTKTDQEPVIVTKLSPSSSGGDQAHNGNPIIDEVVRDISESEANTRLAAFRREHKWDPNMSDEAIELVDVVTAAHDHKGEAQLVGEIIEDSPYPEVSLYRSIHQMYA